MFEGEIYHYCIQENIAYFTLKFFSVNLVNMFAQKSWRVSFLGITLLNILAQNVHK